MAYVPPVLNQAATNTPSIHLWNRLEVRPRSKEFSRSLRAEVRDPGWLLCRQWLMGEYRAEDRASIAFAHIEMETKPVPYYWSSNDPYARTYDQAQRPLETVVEGEAIPIDDAARIAMGEYWFKLLRRAGLDWQNGPGFSAFRENLASWEELRLPDLPNPERDLVAFFQRTTQHDALRLRSVMEGAVIDGYALVILLASEDGGFSRMLSAVSDYAQPSSGNAGDIGDVFKACALSFIAWVERIYGRQDGMGKMLDVNGGYKSNEFKPAWVKQHQEYSFKLGVAQADGTAAALVGDEYTGGRLEWYSVDMLSQEANLEPDPEGGQLPEAASQITTYSFIPTPIQFASTPNARWWEFEDRKLDFSAITGDSSDVGRMLLLEFSLLYSADWHYFPYTVPVGTLNKVKKLFVTDVFGARYEIAAAGASDAPAGENDWGRWALFAQSERGNTKQSEPAVFIAPTVVQTLESAPFEKVQFLRDEMANIVWGIELVVPDGAGGGMDGSRAAQEFNDALLTHLNGNTPLRTIENPGETPAHQFQLVYGSTPENWIPFLPVPQDSSSTTNPIDYDVRLEMGAMQREGIDDPAIAFIDPRTELLEELVEPTPAAAAIFEQEVSREGAIISKTYQRTRWYDGKVILWAGRKKETGRGEGSSGLEFDKLD